MFPLTVLAAYNRVAPLEENLFIAERCVRQEINCFERLIFRVD